MLQKLNQKQEQAIEIHRQQWLDKVFKYELYNSNTFESVRASILKLYEFCGLKEPIVLFLDSPYACQIAANMFSGLDQVRDQVRDQVGGQVWDQVGDQVGGQVWDQVRGQVGDQVGDQVRDQVWGQVGGQVRGQVGDQVGGQVGGQVWDQVRGQVGDQVGGQVGGQVRGQVGDQVGGQVWDQVRGQVGDQVGDQVRDQVWGQVGGQVWDQVGDQVRDQKMNYINFSNYGNSSDFGWLSFYNFFLKETDVKIDKSKDLELCVEFAESCFMSIQLDGLCVVSKYPKSIHRNQNNDMHNTSGFAVEFSDGYGQNYVNGRYLEPQIFSNSQSLDGARNEFMKADNEDIKACIITIVKENFGNTGLMQMLNSVLIDEKVIQHTDDYSEIIRIYHSKDKHSFLQNSKGKLNQPYAWIEMTCPSTGNTYLIDTCPTFKDAIQCAKWHRPEVVPETIPYIWQSAN